MKEGTIDINRDFPKQQSVEALLDVIKSIEAYNLAHNPFRELGANMAGFIPGDRVEVGVDQTDIAFLAKLASEDNIETTPLEKLTVEREQSFQAAKANSIKAESIGLGLDFGTDKRVVVFGLGEDEEGKGKRPKELRLDIIDAGKLISFFKSLTSEDSANTDIRHALVTTAGILIRQLTSYYDVDKPDDRLIELIGNAEVISSELKRLEIFEGVDILDKYLLNARRKTLTEFVKLRDTESLTKPADSGFGPAQWHGDMSPAHYAERWQVMYEAIQNALKNENALPLVNEAIDNLILCASLAVKDMETRLKEPAINEIYAEIWPASINIAKESLHKLEQLKNRVG
jgi:hypothetical protein